MLLLVLGLVVFLGIHSVRIFAPGFREAKIAAWGSGPWRGLYSLVALVGIVLIAWGYGQARQDPVVFWVAPAWMSHLTALLMLFSFIFLAASQVPAGRIKAALKHPMLVAVKIWAFAHLLVNGDLASVILFGAVLAWAVLDRISEKRRLQAGLTRSPVAGPVLRDVIAVVAGIVGYVLFVLYLHEWLIGVPPLPGVAA